MASTVVLPKRVAVMGVPVDPWTMAQTVERTREFVDSGAFAHLIGVNADKVLQMRDDPEMDAIVRRCEIVNADGASMVMAANRLGVPVPERVAGIDLMDELCALAELHGYRVFLLGAKREVVERTRDALIADYPRLDIVGIRDGYFGEEEFDEVAEEVSASGAQVTFVGITSPKKERLIERFRELDLKGVYVGVGGSFDVVSGAIPRAPKWMQQVHLEWLFRMMQEPGRLAKRYIVGNARFMALLRKEQKRMKGAS